MKLEGRLDLRNLLMMNSSKTQNLNGIHLPILVLSKTSADSDEDLTIWLYKRIVEVISVWLFPPIVWG